MSLSHAYGTPPADEVAATVLLKALDLGYTHFDTAALYGFGANEALIGRTLKHRRGEFVLATKGGMFRNAQGQREIDGRPHAIKQHCDESLRRLQTDVIDLYYLHRWDKRLPVEESVGAVADLVKEGKVRAIGLSEVSSSTIRKAHRVHPITAVQTELSLWSRDAEGEVLPTVRELGIGYVAYSPLGRGFLTGQFKSPADFADDDFRKHHPRFNGANFDKNVALVGEVEAMARDKGCTAAQLALAWVLAQGDDVVPIPGTRHINYLDDNIGALDVELSRADLERLDRILPPGAAAGERYHAQGMATVNL